MIKIQDVYKKFDKLTALENINLEVSKGEIFGVIGPDGAGKTTLFRLIASLMIPDGGSIQVSGFDSVKDYKSIRKITGYMPGRFSLYHDLTVKENMQFYARVFGTSVEANYELVEDIYSHIKDFENRQAGRLSGGMKQKLALSCALIHRPVILILDEPTTGVDAVSRKEFWEMLNKIKNEGITIIVSTPYMDEATACDRVALLHEGKILTLDHPNQIVSEYKRMVVAVQSDDMYRLVFDLRTHEEVFSSLLFGQEVHFTSVSGAVDLESLNVFLESKGHENIKIRVANPIIEDVFLDLVKNSAN